MTTQALIERVELVEGTVDLDKRTVECVLIRPGWTLNEKGPYYPKHVLAAAVDRYENARAFANHPTIKDLKDNRGTRRVEDLTGRFFNVRIGEEGELRATRKVYDNPAGNAVWPAIVDSIENGVPTIELSINAFGKGKRGTAPDGKKGQLVESIDIVNSVDDVVEGAAGGTFERFTMSGESLMSNLMQMITEEELTQARPDLVEAMRSQMKRARQDDAVRAITEERDAAQTALQDMTALREENNTQIETMRAENARLLHEVVLEKAFREAKFTPKFEALIRKRLDKAKPEQWASIISDERAKLRAAGIKPAPVAVHGAPLQEARVVTVGQPATATDVIDMNIFDTPDKFQTEMQRRSTMRM